MAVGNNFACFVKGEHMGRTESQEKHIGFLQLVVGLNEIGIDKGVGLVQAGFRKIAVVIETMEKFVVLHQFGWIVKAKLANPVDGIGNGKRIVLLAKGIDKDVELILLKGFSDVFRKARTHAYHFHSVLDLKSRFSRFYESGEVHSKKKPQKN